VNDTSSKFDPPSEFAGNITAQAEALDNYTFTM